MLFINFLIILDSMMGDMQLGTPFSLLNFSAQEISEKDKNKLCHKRNVLSAPLLSLLKWFGLSGHRLQKGHTYYHKTRIF